MNYFFSVLLVSGFALSPLFPSNSTLMLTNSNFDIIIQDLSKPWFILACDSNPRCLDLLPTWNRLAKDFETQFHFGILQQKAAYKISRRLSVSALPSFLYSEDGLHFIPYYWPREYQDLVLFMREGHSKVPSIQHKLLDSPTFRGYIYESMCYFMAEGEKMFDRFFEERGIGWVSSYFKVPLVVCVTLVLVGTLAWAIYRLVKEQILISKLTLKKKQ